jgi:AraC-like DNA-binding protein
MKVHPFKIPKPEKDALIYQEDQDYVFYDKLHQHEEIQVSYILEGEGTLIVGDTVNDYRKGDVIVIGSHLPHVFKSKINDQTKSHMKTLFFTQTAFGVDFFGLEELKEVKSFFKKSVNGFKLIHKSKKINPLFMQLNAASKFQRFIICLELIQILSKSKYSLLSSFIYQKQYSDTEGKRMGDVVEFTINNFQNNISLHQAATVAAMTKNAFCKYFKKRTNKTYFRFLNELRIENASKLLLTQSDYSVAEIAEHSGYNNISNFNRQFRSIKGVVPSKFKKTKAF